MIFNKAFLQRNEASERAEFLCKKALLNIMFIFCPRTGNLYVCEWDIAVSRNNEIFLIKNEKLLYQHSETTVLISFMTPYPSTSLFLATGLRRCLVLFRMLPVTYISRWRHESMRSFNKLSADTVLCARNKNMRFAAVRSSRWFFRQNVFLCS